MIISKCPEFARAILKRKCYFINYSDKYVEYYYKLLLLYENCLKLINERYRAKRVQYINII